MIPKDFNSLLMTGLDIHLSYKRWLVNGDDIDIYEMVSAMVVYARGDVEEKIAGKYMLILTFASVV